MNRCCAEKVELWLLNTLPQKKLPIEPLTAHKVRASWPALLALAAVGLFFIILGYDGRRIAQLFILMMPPLIWLAWPISNAFQLKFRRLLACSWIMLFALDGATRSYLLELYQSPPDGMMVLAAMANTNWRESSEYLSMHWPSFLLISGVLVLAALLVWRVSGLSTSKPNGQERRLATVSLILLLVCVLAYSSKSWRRFHPVIFWNKWTQIAQNLNSNLADQTKERSRLLARAVDAKPTLSHEGPSTVVLMLSESINRDNLSLYGYPRQTTPELQALQKASGSQMTVLRNAWSVDASTLPALRNFFSFGAPDSQNSHHLIALAKASGYKVWWISNHDDIAIDQQHAQLADTVQMINRIPGRSSLSLDGEMLDELKEALETSTERKFIVVHMQGAHPHYKLRYPKEKSSFDATEDIIDTSMKEKGISSWVRSLRQNYDSALLYNDHVSAQALRLTQSINRPGQRLAWIYLSDHGQEVGHVTNHAGHSKSTEAGYRIPALFWQNAGSKALPEGVSDRPFRADWAAWTVADLLGMHWSDASSERNVLSQAYQWQAPSLPMPVTSFTQ